MDPAADKPAKKRKASAASKSSKASSGSRKSKSSKASTKSTDVHEKLADTVQGRKDTLTAAASHKSDLQSAASQKLQSNQTVEEIQRKMQKNQPEETSKLMQAEKRYERKLGERSKEDHTLSTGATRHPRDNTGEKEGRSKISKVPGITQFFVCVLLVAVVISIIVIVVLLYRWFYPEKGILCNTGECRHVLSEIEQLLSTNIDPCDDFYGYVCGKWANKPNSGFLDDVMTIYNETLIDSIFSQQSLQRSRLGRHVFSGIYRKCDDYIKRGKGSFQDAVEDISRLIDIDKLREARDGSALFAYLTGLVLKTGVHTFYTIEFHLVDKVTAMHICLGHSIQQKISAGHDLSVINVTTISNLTLSFLKRTVFGLNVTNETNADDLFDIDEDVHQNLLKPALLPEKNTFQEHRQSDFDKNSRRRHQQDCAFTASSRTRRCGFGIWD
ncbi:uncharacterized protein LOC135393338 [Ornithodoros turicata]|uniref:uncharacterized protein LOC135393338 n=1 Tax=Ornithodoros turicata TaxID=34597 RepID=UPI003138E2CE